MADAGVGVDLRPPNYAFVAGNILEGLPFADGGFDFVHMRLVFFAIPADRWPFVIGELVRVTRLGAGWNRLRWPRRAMVARQWTGSSRGRPISSPAGALISPSAPKSVTCYVARVCRRSTPTQFHRRSGRMAVG